MPPEQTGRAIMEIHAAEREAWLKEREILLRRIRNQRKTLRRLEKSYQTLRLVKERYMMESFWRQSRHIEAAAKVAERFWFGRRIARAIRRAA